MASPLIAVVGSADPTRTYDPPVDSDVAKRIARALGAELAKQSCSLMVYSGSDKFIEADVVAGFVQANPSSAQSIVLRYPQRSARGEFPQEKTHSKLFKPEADRSDDWQASFYRSVATADGVLLIGGERSTLIAGQVAVGARIPLVAVAASGGAAAQVWKTLSAGEDLPTRDEQTLMGQPWMDGSAAACVKALLDQRRRRYAVETGPTVMHSLVAVLLFVASILIALWSATQARTWLLYVATLLGGGAGASIRTVFECRYGGALSVPRSVIVTLALGMIAGGLAGMLYLGAQPGAVDLKSDGAVRLVSFVAIVSVLGGLTAEAVYRKLLGLDVVHSRLLAVEDLTKGSS
jgi:hypothetical protein